MPAAPSFATFGPLPSCVSEIGPFFPQYDYVGGLTAQQAATLFWGLADVEITTAGTSTIGATTASAAGSFKFNPPTANGDYNNALAWGYTRCAMLFGSDELLTDISDMPQATRLPGERICGTMPLLLTFTATSDAGTSLQKVHLILWNMRFNRDPTDSSKYALYYRFIIRAGDYNSVQVSFSNPAFGQQSASGSFTTGTFQIGGHTFNWRCYYNTSLSGESMSATTSTFTY